MLTVRKSPRASGTFWKPVLRNRVEVLAPSTTALSKIEAVRFFRTSNVVVAGLVSPTVNLTLSMVAGNSIYNLPMPVYAASGPWNEKM
jgi:hypothetical protein